MHTIRRWMTLLEQEAEHARRMITTSALSEAATPHGASYWYNPSTNEIIHASDHGDAVMHDPGRFGIDYGTVGGMQAAFPPGSESDDDVEEPPYEDDDGSVDEPPDVSELPEGLWGSRSGWHRNDAWEQLGMNAGWVRVGEESGIASAYISAATAEAAWAAVKFVHVNGGITHRVEIEISSEGFQAFVGFEDAALIKFIRGGPRRAQQAIIAEKSGIAEAYQAGGYSAAIWRRWWGNDQTGTVLPVDLRDDHDAYLFAHLDEFFTPAELQQLPDPEDVQSYETADPDDPIQNSSDEILIAAYNKGWHAVLYDANNKHLSLRTSQHANLRGLRKIIRSITTDVPVIRLIMEIGPTEHRLDDDEIERLIKFGRLPPR